MYVDARQWFQARDTATKTSYSERLVNLMGMEPSRLDVSSMLISTTSTSKYQVPLVSLYRAFECVRALFPGHLPLLNDIETALFNLPSMSDDSTPNERLLEMEFVLETILYQYEVWVRNSISLRGGSVSLKENASRGLQVSVPNSGSVAPGMSITSQYNLLTNMYHVHY